MDKEMFQIEYLFDTASKNSLWNHIGSSHGLSGWFADKVSNDGNVYTFTWNKHSMMAEIVGNVSGSFIRFHWLDDENPDSFFEFKLHKNELTGGLTLEITDFATPDEKEASINLWNKQIKDLTRLVGL